MNLVQRTAPAVVRVFSGLFRTAVTLCVLAAFVCGSSGTSVAGANARSLAFESGFSGEDIRCSVVRNGIEISLLNVKPKTNASTGLAKIEPDVELRTGETLVVRAYRCEAFKCSLLLTEVRGVVPGADKPFCAIRFQKGATSKLELQWTDKAPGSK